MAAVDPGFMRLAIDLARPRLGRTGDNPAVGCIIVKDGAVIGRGATAEGGRPHAEEAALLQAGEDARGATAYVTLEPCGERSAGTPSCAERLARAGVSRVVVACADPSPLASGRGGERLKAEGVTLETGVLADEAAFLYADYLSRLATDRSSR